MYRLITTLDRLKTCKDEKSVYLGVRPSNRDFMKFLGNNPDLENLIVARTFENVFSKMAFNLCEMKGVRVRFLNLQGQEVRYYADVDLEGLELIA